MNTDIVTHVEKKGRKFLVTVNEEHHLTVPYSIFQQRPLDINDPLNLEEYEQWLMVRQFKYAFNQAVAFLAQRARSEKEVYDKVIRIGSLPQTAQMVVYKLKDLSLLDDYDFALQWIESRHRRQIGKYKIQEELFKKGISKSIMEKAFLAATPYEDASFEEEDLELHKALAQGEKLFLRYQKEPKEKQKQKLLHGLVRKGFSWEVAKTALLQIIQEDET
ncbi:MAG: hypothetical protein GX786_05730 [Clostridiales bacterium]|nr:hypothetical protein [Clostridiales bacterium]